MQLIPVFVLVLASWFYEQAMRNSQRSQKALIVALGSVALLTVCAQAQQKQTYKDPGGAYSVLVPAGWEAQPQQGNPMVSIVNAKTQISVTTGVMKGPAANTPTAEKELEGIQAQFPQSCPQAKIQDKGAEALAGMQGSFMLVHCSSAQGAGETMKFIAASKPGVVALMVVASPGLAYMKELLPLSEIKASLKALGATGSSGGSNASMNNAQGQGQGQGQMPATGNGQGQMQGSGQMEAMGNGQGQMQGGGFPDPAGSGGGSGPFRDPKGRYTLTPPSGWNTAVDGNAGTATFSQNGSWATVATGGGAQPAEANRNVVQQIQAQYKDFKILNEGDFQNNGHPAHGTNATGINPKGARVSVLVVSIGVGSSNYLTVISSAPNDQAKAVNGLVMQMVQSVRFSGE